MTDTERFNIGDQVRHGMQPADDPSAIVTAVDRALDPELDQVTVDYVWNGESRTATVSAWRLSHC